MIRLIAATVALLGLAVACGGERETTSSGSAAHTQAEPPAAHVSRERPQAARVLVTVVDGDTHGRVRGARVVIGHRAGYTNTTGLAAVKVKRRAAFPVRVSKPGYATRIVRMPFKQHREVTIRLYRDSLQWPMYGANSRRTQAHGDIKLRPPFKVVWSRGIGTLIEFPAVITGGVAYIGNYKGTIYALEHARRQGDLEVRPTGREDGLVARDRRATASSFTAWTASSASSTASSGRRRWSFHVGSPIESSPVVRGGLDYFGAWNGRVYALDLKRRKLRWTWRSGYKITSSAAIAGQTALHRRLRRPAARALHPHRRTARLRARSNGRVYGTPAIAAGRVFVPSSTGNR